MPKKLKARVFWSHPNSSWSSYFLKEIWKGKKVASSSFNTRSSNSTECSYSSGLLWINDRIPQRTDPKGFFLSNGVYLQVHEKEKSSHGSCAGKGITATARRKVGSKAGVLWILQKKKKRKKEMKHFLCFPRHHASYTLQYSFASSVNCQFICL